MAWDVCEKPKNNTGKLWDGVAVAGVIVKVVDSALGVLGLWEARLPASP